MFIDRTAQKKLYFRMTPTQTLNESGANPIVCRRQNIVTDESVLAGIEDGGSMGIVTIGDHQDLKTIYR